MNSIKIISQLVSSLPEKDIPIGIKFIEKRDFISLKELVDSAIIIVKRDRLKEVQKEQYIHVDLDKLETLKMEVNSYLLILGEDITELSNIEEEEIENNINIETY